MPRSSIPSRVRWHVWERDDFTCQHCSRRSDLTIDHIVPLARGGTDAVDNLQTLCQKCNSRKWTRPNAVPDPARLEEVRSTTAIAAAAKRERNHEIRDAHKQGETIRAIAAAAAAGLSPARVHQILHGR